MEIDDESTGCDRNLMSIMLGSILHQISVTPNLHLYKLNL